MTPAFEEQILRVVLEHYLNAALIILLLEERSQQSLGLRMRNLALQFLLRTLIAVIPPPARQMLNKIVLPEPSRNERLANKLIDQQRESSTFGGALGMCVRVGVEERGDWVVPVEGEAALEVVGLFVVVVVELGPGDLLPGVEVLEVVVLEVVEDELFVFGGGHEAGLCLLSLRLASHHILQHRNLYSLA